jgi:hypothetical protein
MSKLQTAEGGYLVHSRITTGDLTTEVFHRVDAKRRPSFAEVTKMRGEERTRTRFNIDGNTMTARMRGSVSGVIAQTLEVPERFFLSSPGIAAAGFMQLPETGHSPISGYLTPEQFEQAMGTLELMSWDAKGEEAVRVPAGEFRTRHVVFKTGRGTSDLWLDSKLGIPVKCQSSGVEYVLTTLEPAGK